MGYSLAVLLKTLVEKGGSDLHISANSPPRIRVDGVLKPVDGPDMTPQETQELCLTALNDDQKKKLAKEKEVDLSFAVKNLARFRANIFTQLQTIGGAFRVVPNRIKTIEDLGLPAITKKLCALPNGIVLVTGPTGSGKSTSLAAMIDYINDTREEHIVTIEDPIEYVHTHKKCIINQRAIGPDTHSFTQALKSLLRQDPDVVLIGEMRDLETIRTALTTAETGHLVFATLHTNSAVQTLNRIIDVFPPHQQDQVRTQLAQTISGILSQTLVPAVPRGRELAMEILVPNSGIRALIAEGKFNQIYSLMQSGQNESGMQTLNQCLLDLMVRGRISKETAYRRSPNKTEFLDMLKDRNINTNFLSRVV